MIKETILHYRQQSWMILVEFYQSNTPANLYWNWSSGFWQENVVFFLYRYIGKISPAPWRPYFWTNHDGLNNRGRGSQKKNFCQIILKSVWGFLTRRVLKFLCFSVLLVLWLPRLGRRELILVLFVRSFDLCLCGFVGFLFLLGSGKGCGLWLWHSLDFYLTFFFYIDI